MFKNMFYYLHKNNMSCYFTTYYRLTVEYSFNKRFLSCDLGKIRA
jgi:hypothetical protein